MAFEGKRSFWGVDGRMKTKSVSRISCPLPCHSKVGRRRGGKDPVRGAGAGRENGEAVPEKGQKGVRPPPSGAKSPRRVFRPLGSERDECGGKEGRDRRKGLPLPDLLGQLCELLRREEVSAVLEGHEKGGLPMSRQDKGRDPWGGASGGPDKPGRRWGGGRPRFSGSPGGSGSFFSQDFEGGNRVGTGEIRLDSAQGTGAKKILRRLPKDDLCGSRSVGEGEDDGDPVGAHSFGGNLDGGPGDQSAGRRKLERGESPG